MIDALKIFFEGVALGIVISITLGPAFLTIIQTSIDRGFRSALLVAIGVAISDLMLIAISYLGLSSLLERGNNQIYFGIIGGVILILYGIYTFLKKPEALKRIPKITTSPIKKVSPITFLAKGFFLNIANPFLIIFWLSIIGYISQIAPYGKMRETTILFISGTVLTVFSIDILKSYIGYKIKRYLNSRVQLIINRIVGIILTLFGIVLILRLFFNFSFDF
ncbi:MAG: LysE family translocator [Bacteroidales bacterium]|nr:LysE family translocator [Bacteroidales bacterium]